MAEQVKEREWVRVVVAVVFVIAVVGLFSFLFRDRSMKTATVTPGFNMEIKDSFNRRSGSIEAGSKTPDWKAMRGSWSVAAGAAFVSGPAPFVNIVVVKANANASVKALVSGRGYCGVIANYVNESDYLTLVRIEKYGVWNLEHRVNGTPRVLATVGGSQAVALTASIILDPPIVTATIGDKHVSVSISDLAAGSSAGLYAADPNPSECAFDDVVISRPN